MEESAGVGGFTPVNQRGQLSIPELSQASKRKFSAGQSTGSDSDEYEGLDESPPSPNLGGSEPLLKRRTLVVSAHYKRRTEGLRVCTTFTLMVWTKANLMAVTRSVVM